MFSALPLRADIAEQSRHVRFVLPCTNVSDLTRGNATFRPAKRTLAQLGGGLDSRGDSLKTAGTNRRGPGRDVLRRRAPAPGLRTSKLGPIPPAPHSLSERCC